MNRLRLGQIPLGDLLAEGSPTPFEPSGATSSGTSGTGGSVFKLLTEEDYLPARRVGIVGPPNSFKTTSLLTWPYTPEEPLVIMSYPGEKGWETIPHNVPGILPLIWQFEDPEKESPHKVVRAVEEKTWEVLSGAGPFKRIKTFAGDGLHKLYYWFYKRRRVEIADWWLLDKNLKGDPEAVAQNERQLDLSAYGSPTSGAHAEVMLYLSKVLSSTIPYAVITMWEEPEADDPQNPRKGAHIFPALPGKLASRIVGEFGAIVSAEVSLPDPMGRRKGTWQIRPAGKVWGVGVKVRPEIAKALPEKIEQSFPALEKLLRGEK